MTKQILLKTKKLKKCFESRLHSFSPAFTQLVLFIVIYCFFKERTQSAATLNVDGFGRFSHEIIAVELISVMVRWLGNQSSITEKVPEGHGYFLSPFGKYQKNKLFKDKLTVVEQRNVIRFVSSFYWIPSKREKSQTF